ncbi:MAG: hypothetical protein HY579_01395 [Nitrospinae bacterium]|nr:hypothetical protein [Nitrospinota bacterium]
MDVANVGSFAAAGKFNANAKTSALEDAKPNTGTLKEVEGTGLNNIEPAGNREADAITASPAPVETEEENNTTQTQTQASSQGQTTGNKIDVLA